MRYLCYVPGVTRNKFRKPKFGILKVSKKQFLNLTKFINNNKIIIYKSNGKYLFNQRKSNLQYLICPNCPQNIYQHKSFSSFWSPDSEVKSKWTLSLNPKLNNPKLSRINKLNIKYSSIEFQHKRLRFLNGEIILKISLWKIYSYILFKKVPEQSGNNYDIIC